MCCSIYVQSQLQRQKPSSSEERVKKRDESKQEAHWDAALVCKSFSSQTAFVLVLNTHCSYSASQCFWFQKVPLLKTKPRLFNLATVCMQVMGRTWLVTHEFFDFVFSSCTLPITREPLGEQEPLVNQPLMWEAQSPRQQNCFSLILHVFELRNQPPWTWLLREPCCLPASDEKAEQGGIKKKERCMPLAFI